MPKFFDHDDVRPRADLLIELFRAKPELSADELRRAGFQNPASELKRPLLIAYLGQGGIAIRILHKGERFVAEPLLPPNRPPPGSPPDRSPPLPRTPGAGGNGHPEGGEPYFHFPRETEIIRDVLRLRIPLWLVGPTGCGKSTLLRRLLAEITPGPVFSMCLHGEITIDDFFGAKELRNGSTEHRPGPALKAMLEGRPLIVEEIDAADASVLFGLHPLAAKEPVTMTGVTGADGHPLTLDPWSRPDFCLCATGNTSGYGDTTGLHTGTRTQNIALSNRFIVVELDYPTKLQECRILEERTGIDLFHTRRIVEVARLARAAFRAGKNVTPVSVRDTLRWAEFMVRSGRTAESAFEITVINGAVPDDRKSLRELFQRVFGKRGRS